MRALDQFLMMQPKTNHAMEFSLYLMAQQKAVHAAGFNP